MQVTTTSTTTTTTTAVTTTTTAETPTLILSSNTTTAIMAIPAMIYFATYALFLFGQEEVVSGRSVGQMHPK